MQYSTDGDVGDIALGGNLICQEPRKLFQRRQRAAVYGNMSVISRYVRRDSFRSPNLLVVFLCVYIAS